MIKSKIYDFLHKNLGEYLYGLAEDQLDVAILSGHINFSNANFKPAKVNASLMAAGLPLNLKAGMIGNLQIKFSIMSWLSNPLNIVIDDLYLVLGPIVTKDPDPSNSLNPLECSSSDEEEISWDQKLDSYESESDEEEQRHVPQKPKAAKPKEKGTLEKYLSKVLMNLTLTVNNVHIRYEDETYPYMHPFSFGMCLSSLVLHSSKGEWTFKSVHSSDVSIRTPKEVLAMKEGQVKDFFIYVNSMSDMAIPTSLYEATIDSPIGIFEALAAYELRELLVSQQEILAASPQNCVLCPTSAQWNLILGEKSPAIKLALILPDIRVRISTSMQECLNNFFTYLTNAQLWGIIQRYKPLYRIDSIPRENPNEPKYITAKRRKIIRKWFIYALKFQWVKRKLRHFIQKKKREVRRAQRNQGNTSASPFNKGNDNQSCASNDSFDHPLSIVTNYMENVVPTVKNKKFTLADLSKPRQRMVPGVKRDNQLSLVVRNYNQQLLKSSTASSSSKPGKPPLNPNTKPVQPEPVAREAQWYEPLMIETRIASVTLLFEDDEGDVHLELKAQQIGQDISVTPKETLSSGGVTEVSVVLKERNSCIDLVQLGKYVAPIQEPKGTGSLLSNIFSRDVPEKSQSQYAANYRIVYRPGYKMGRLGDPVNAFDLQLTLAPVTLSYSHQVLSSGLKLMEAYQIDALRRQNMGADVQRTVSQRKATRIEQEKKAMKKKKNDEPDSSTSQIAHTFLRLKNQLNTYTKKFDQTLADVNYNINTQFGGAKVNILTPENQQVLFNLNLPISNFVATKNDSASKTSILGCEASSQMTLEAGIGFVKQATEMAYDKWEYLKEFCKRVKSV